MTVEPSFGGLSHSSTLYSAAVSLSCSDGASQSGSPVVFRDCDSQSSRMAVPLNVAQFPSGRSRQYFSQRLALNRGYQAGWGGLLMGQYDMYGPGCGRRCEARASDDKALGQLLRGRKGIVLVVRGGSTGGRCIKSDQRSAIEDTLAEGSN